MEGPSLVILKEELTPFKNKKVLNVTGNTKQPKDILEGRKLLKIDTWAKVLFLTFSSSKKTEAPLVIKTHFLLFGSYRINEPRENAIPRLEMTFANGVVSFYSCSILFEADEYLEKVDREVDVMAREWNEKHVLKLMEEKKDTYLCDLFLDQHVFAGAGNIVKNEVLFNLRRHPLTKLSEIEKRSWVKMARAVKDYCHHFYEWKKEFQLRKHWQVHRKLICPICERKLIKKKLGKLARMSYHCSFCQNKRLTAETLKVHKVLPVAKTSEKEKRLDH
jgi:endonuclease-8